MKSVGMGYNKARINIEALKAENEALKAEIKELKAKLESTEKSKK